MNTNFNFSDMNDFNEFISFVKSHAVQRRYSKGEPLSLNKKDIGFVLDGLIGVYYKGNGKFIEHSFYGMPIMGYNKITKKNPFYYRVESEAVIAMLSVEHIFEYHDANETNRGIVLLSLIYTIFEKLAVVYETRHSGNGYHVIRELIERYNYDSPLGQGLASYILKRTYLSNSYVFKVLATLKKCQFIEMDNARLVKILKPLPDKVSLIK